MLCGGSSGVDSASGAASADGGDSGGGGGAKTSFIVTLSTDNHSCVIHNNGFVMKSRGTPKCVGWQAVMRLCGCLRCAK